jgi:hypothetical protein
MKPLEISKGDGLPAAGAQNVIGNRWRRLPEILLQRERSQIKHAVTAPCDLVECFDLSPIHASSMRAKY